MRPTSLYGAILIGFCVLLQACGHNAGKTDAIVLAGNSECSRHLQAFESRARAAGIWLSEPRAVPAFPALGTNRFLASFNPVGLDAARREAWLQRLLTAGQRRRALLMQMLAQQNSARAVVDVDTLRLERCAQQLLDDFSRSEDAWEDLAEAVQVDDDYSLWRRSLGVYPLVSFGARGGIAELQEELHQSYTLPAEELPAQGDVLYYGPPAMTFTPFMPISNDALGIMRPSGDQLQDLLATHAPVWAVDTAGDFDRPGVPFVSGERIPRVESASPVTYTFASMTRFRGVPHLQLNYLVWFDARPRVGALDTLGGALDGLLWRVTLDYDGGVLMYDSVHACGCYHLFFPGSRIELRDLARTFPEPPLVMQAAPELARGERPLLRVSSGAHYLEGVSRWPATGATATGDTRTLLPYTMAPYEALYGTQHPDGRRSLFDDDGIVRGSERLERYYLWPMGIRSPGAMRERGRQATAFVGRRHFDDADLLDRLFQYRHRAGPQ